jgi:hypothetical protein
MLRSGGIVKNGDKFLVKGYVYKFFIQGYKCGVQGYKPFWLSGKVLKNGIFSDSDKLHPIEKAVERREGIYSKNENEFALYTLNPSHICAKLRPIKKAVERSQGKFIQKTK